MTENIILSEYNYKEIEKVRTLPKLKSANDVVSLLMSVAIKCLLEHEGSNIVESLSDVQKFEDLDYLCLSLSDVVDPTTVKVRADKSNKL
jgi:hypothetical protein